MVFEGIDSNTIITLMRYSLRMPQFEYFSIVTERKSVLNLRFFSFQGSGIFPKEPKVTSKRYLNVYLSE